jgi:hypothetical protein
VKANCAGCGTAISPSGPMDLRRKWCSERCRKRSYAQPCIDCGARTIFGAEREKVEEPRCASCSAAHRRVWTSERILETIRAWAAEHGEPPAMADWNPWASEHAYGDAERAQRARLGLRDGHHPSATHVVYAFGTWSAALEAAGFEGRAAHGGGGNVRRRRNQRPHPVPPKSPPNAADMLGDITPKPRDRTVWLGMHTGYPPMIAFSTEEAAHEWLREKGEGYQTTTVPLDPPEVDDA